jgi:regulator of protease activity HflC (stomatin/prohibitin superfamily)
MLIGSVLGGIVLIVLVVFYIVFERKRPDQLILIEKKGNVIVWTYAFYPKYRCLSLPYTTRSVSTEVKTQARGKVDVVIKLTVSFYPDAEHIENLIHIGGWSTDALSHIEKELAGTAQGIIGEIIEPLDITEMPRENIAKTVKVRLNASAENIGIKITGVTVINAEASDLKIVEAIKKREEARIQEEAEKTIQASRIAQAEMKAQADQAILSAEHDTAMKKLALRRIEEAEAAILAKAALEQQVERRNIELTVEKAEVELLAKNPSLLLLSPQLTRLTEASQQLKNAETVVTLSNDCFNQLPQPLQQILNLLKTEKPAGE